MSRKDKEMETNTKESQDHEANVRDVTDDNAEAAVSEETTSPEAEETAEIDRLKSLVESLEDKLLRTVAEFDNYKKRTARQYDEMHASAGDRVLTDLLEVADNFDRALAHSRGDAESGSLLEGMELIRTQIADLLNKYQVEPIEAVGKTFDPSVHEALMQIPSDEYDSGTVALEVSRGYKRGGRVLRFAKVGVSSGPAEGNKEDENNE